MAGAARWEVVREGAVLEPHTSNALKVEPPTHLAPSYVATIFAVGGVVGALREGLPTDSTLCLAIITMFWRFHS